MCVTVGPMKKRFLTGQPWPALGVLAGIAILSVYAGLHLPPALPPKAGEFDDIALYQIIVTRVRSGENYYAAAAAEQRAHGYPTRPAVAIREPTEAWMLATLSTETARRTAMLLLAAFTVFSLFYALEWQGASPLKRVAGAVLATTGTVVSVTNPYVHEAWASLLISSAVCVWRPGRYRASVALAFTSCLFRELAVPVLLAMGACAALDRRWREVGAWCAATVVFGMVVLIHLWFASHAALPGDRVSPGWAAFGGWLFILANARRNVAFHFLPAPLLSVVVALALLGFLKADGPIGRRIATTTFTFVVLFWFVGRSDNDYWGVVYQSMLPLGLLYTPRLLRDSGLIEFLTGRPRGIVQVSSPLRSPRAPTDI